MLAGIQGASADDSRSEVDRAQLHQDAIDRFLHDPDTSETTFSEDLGHEDWQTTDTPVEAYDDDLDEELSLGKESTKTTEIYVKAYKSFIHTTPEYQLLLANIRREARLTRGHPDVMGDIRRQILAALPPKQTVSRRKSSQEHHARFSLDWDPLGFVQQQEYIESTDEALEKAITITGSAEDAQAMTTGEYLGQTWPGSGQQVIDLLKSVVRNTTDWAATSKLIVSRRETAIHTDLNFTAYLSDGTKLEARRLKDTFHISTYGPEESIAEVGQLFAWLGAALRTSPYARGVARCVPVLRRATHQLTKDLVPSSYAAGVINFDIHFEMDDLAPISSADTPPGRCWHDMFRNPVLVGGYPIITKPRHGMGLEIPLNIMAALTGSERVDEFDEKVFIKGFTALLVATETVEGLILWHYLYNPEGKRVSYSEYPHDVSNYISPSHVNAARHVVGWCATCKTYAGGSLNFFQLIEIHLLITRVYSRSLGRTIRPNPRIDSSRASCDLHARKSVNLRWHVCHRWRHLCDRGKRPATALDSTQLYSKAHVDGDAACCPLG